MSETEKETIHEAIEEWISENEANLKDKVAECIQKWHDESGKSFIYIPSDTTEEKIHYLERMHIITALQSEIIKHFKIRLWVFLGVTGTIISFGIAALIQFAQANIEKNLETKSTEMSSKLVEKISDAKADGVIQIRDAMKKELDKQTQELATKQDRFFKEMQLRFEKEFTINQVSEATDSDPGIFSQ